MKTSVRCKSKKKKVAMTNIKVEEKTSKSGCISALEAPTMSGNDGADKAESGFTQDLKSVLVTSVLNLEELDIDLYR